MAKRPFPFDEASLDECIAKRARLLEKLTLANARIRELQPPPPAEIANGPPCSGCSSNSVLRTSQSAKNPGRQFWSCPNRCPGWIGWADVKEAIVGTCTVCQQSRKFGLKGEAIPSDVKEAIEKGTYMCAKCADDVNF